MLGHAEEWFYRGLGGVNVDLTRPSAEKLVLHPAMVGNVAWVHTSYKSALGLVESNWKRGDKETEYDFEIPANTTVTIELDTASPGTVTVDGVEPSKAAGILSANTHGNLVQIVAASGRYHVRTTNPNKASSIKEH
jgi:hypothetical protein